MNKKYLYALLGVVAVLGIVGTGVATAKFFSDDELFTDFFDRGYYQKLLEKGPQDKIAQTALEKLRQFVLEKQVSMDAMKKLSPKEIADGEKKMADDLAKSSREQALQSQSLALLFEGVVAGRTLDPGKDFETITSWGGMVNSDRVYVFAGYRPTNPTQGGVEVVNDTRSVSQIYPTPTATGPVKIISEKDGVLTLQSVGEEYDQLKSDGTYGKVTVEGGVTYRFNLKKGAFE